MNVRTLTPRGTVVLLPDGTRTLVLDFEVPEDAPPEVREGFARRSLVNRGRVCPCGAQLPTYDRARRRAGIACVAVEHEPDCPAVDDNLVPLLKAWLTGAL